MLIIAAAALCSACAAKHDSEAKAEETEAVCEDPEVQADNEVINQVNRWLAALNNGDASMSRQVFAPEVLFYHQKMSGSKCTDMRMDLVKQKPGYRQQIDGDIAVERLSDTRRKASFTKSSAYGGEQNSYEAYLVFEKNAAGEWLIVEEGDLTTDDNLARAEKRKKMGMPKNAVKGDFDGDGINEYIWIQGKYDSDGYAQGPLVLRSENDIIDRSRSWNVGRGVTLHNLGTLAGDRRQFIGALPFSDSSWCTYELLGVKNGKMKVFTSFTVWEGSDSTEPRVKKGNGPGDVVLRTNDMSGDDFSDFYQRRYIEF